MDHQQKSEIIKLLGLLAYDISWILIGSENHSKELKRMMKILRLIESALDNDPINAKRIATLLYDDDLSAGLLDLNLFD